MSGYIDIHSHFIHGMDDGAQNREETLAILAHARQAGFTGVVATPHVMIGVYEPAREVLEQSIEDLRADLAAESSPMQLLPGAEYYLDEHFFSLLQEGGLHPLGESDHLLVELPMLRIPPMARDLAFRIRVKGMVPVLAHPERYHEIARKPKIVVSLKNAGYLLQINIGSLVGMYGSGPRKAAEWMLKNNLVEFVGSDAHTPQQAQMVYGEGIETLEKYIGAEKLRQLLVDNPRRALRWLLTSKEGA